MLIPYSQTRCYAVIMKFLCDSLMIFNFLTNVCFCQCWDLIYIRITYSPLHLDIHICTSIVLHIDVYEEIFCIICYFIFTLILKEIYTYSASNYPVLSEIYLITFNSLLTKITCHRIIMISLLVAANDAVNKMLPWADHYVWSQDSSSPSGFGKR